MRRSREGELKVKVVKKMVKANHTRRLRVLMLTQQEGFFLLITNEPCEKFVDQIKSLILMERS